MKYRRGNKNVEDLSRDEVDALLNSIVSKVTARADFRPFIILDWVNSLLLSKGLIEEKRERE